MSRNHTGTLLGLLLLSAVSGLTGCTGPSAVNPPQSESANLVSADASASATEQIVSTADSSSETAPAATENPPSDPEASSAATPEPTARFPEPEPRTATGAKQGTYYEIFVRAFADGDGDGTGDFKGLTKKLDYLNDGNDATASDLGVTGIWLMPIHPSPSYHGYDVTDYRNINPDYGTMADFDEFLAAAHKRGISVIIDLVLNHTSTENPWFVKSAAKSPEFRNWYHWAEPDTTQYNLDVKVWGKQVWYPRGSSSYYALFSDTMPDLNYDEPEVRKEMKSVAKFWLDKGVDGFRLDAVPHIYATAEQIDNKPGLDQTISWWQEFRTSCESVRPDVLIVGEVFEKMAVRVPYAAALDSLFHMDLGEAIANAVKGGGSKNDYLAGLLERELGQYRAGNPDFLDCPFLSNHDQNRIMGLLGGKQDKMKLAASMFLTEEGLPFVYYGEELGQFGSKPDEDIRLPFLWGEDPLQTSWRTSRYANTTTAAIQETDADSLLTHYKRLIQLRAAHPALHSGRLSALKLNVPAIIAWNMTHSAEKAIILHNLSTESQTISLAEAVKNPGEWSAGFVQIPDGFAWPDASSGAAPASIVLPPGSSTVLFSTIGGTHE